MRENKQSEKHKHVSRIDQVSKGVHAWYVRVRFEGKIHCKLFSDLMLGGRDKSLAAAIAWRDAQEKKLGKPRTDRNIVSVSRTSTGVVGVRHDQKKNRFEVTWVTPTGTQGKTTVSILMYGWDKAFQIACGIRAAKEAERTGASQK